MNLKQYEKYCKKLNKKISVEAIKVDNKIIYRTLLPNKRLARTIANKIDKEPFNEVVSIYDIENPLSIYKTVINVRRYYDRTKRSKLAKNPNK